MGAFTGTGSFECLYPAGGVQTSATFVQKTFVSVGPLFFLCWIEVDISVLFLEAVYSYAAGQILKNILFSRCLEVWGGSRWGLQRGYGVGLGGKLSMEIAPKIMALWFSFLGGGFCSHVNHQKMP